MFYNLIKKGLKNVKKGVITTLIGLVFMIGAPISVFTLEKVTWTEAGGAILIGLALVFSPDELIKKSTKE